MKALTIWQPWATLILMKVKPYEFRGWKAPGAIVGQRIAIHAGARPVRVREVHDLIRTLESGNAWLSGLKPEALEILKSIAAEPNMLPRSNVLCTAMLGTPRSGLDVAAEFGHTFFNDIDLHEHANWAWPLTDIEPLVPAVAARGMQGFWEWRA